MSKWQSVKTTDFCDAVKRLEPRNVFRVGTDESQIIYILPESHTFPADIEELAHNMTASQVLLLFKAIKYSDKTVLWNTKGHKPWCNPVITQQTLTDEEKRFEAFIDILAENNALRDEVRELEQRIQSLLKKNEQSEKRTERFVKENKRLAISNSLLQNRSLK